MKIKGELFKTKAFKMADTYSKPSGMFIPDNHVSKDKLIALVKRWRVGIEDGCGCSGCLNLEQCADELEKLIS